MLLQQRFPFLCCGAGCVVATGHSAVNDDDDDSFAAGGKIITSSACRQLSWAQVESMTCGFTSTVVGEGGFSTVYLARHAGSLSAVKVHRSSERLHRAFRHELHALLRLGRHPHIVRLLAFCDHPGANQGVLVLELAPNGNLHDHLHGGAAKMMPWARRVLVALQVARALEYLHDRCEVVHGDVKASNVLLDATMGARLCDFGSSTARAGAPSAVVRSVAMLGSPGYVDPHYLRSGVLTEKSDVYSFGVLLLELLTGTQPFLDGRRMLTSVVASRMIKAGSACDVHGLVDQRLGCQYDAAEAAAIAALAAACVGEENPSLRPSMSEVVRALEQAGAAPISTVRR